MPNLETKYAKKKKSCLDGVAEFRQTDMEGKRTLAEQFCQ